MFGGSPEAERCGERIAALAGKAVSGSPGLEPAVAETRDVFAALRLDGARRNLIADLRRMADHLAREAEVETDELSFEIAEKRREEGLGGL